MISDFRLAFRALGRAPLFTVAAVLCLGLGLGANATVFSIVNAMLVRPLPFDRPERLVLLRYTMEQGEQDNFSMPYALDVLGRARSFERAAMYGTRLATVSGRGDAEAVTVVEASDAFFDVLGTRPLFGRGFAAGESRPGAAPVVVLSEGFWRARLGADPGVLGQELVLDGTPHAIVGIMPERVGLTGDREAMWTPLAHRADPSQRGSHWLRVVARLREGVTPAAADAEVRAIGRALAAENAQDRGFGAIAAPLRDRMVPGAIVLVFSIMMGAVGLVLLVACANLANLLLARGTARARELAVRSALGAGRARVVRLLLAEAVLLALGGAALGVGIAHLAMTALTHAVPVAYPRWIQFSLDWRVPAYAFALSLAAALAAGLLPALRATAPDVAGMLRGGGRGTTARGGRLRDGLVVGALALSVVLLTGAGLLVRSVLALESADPGFDEQGVLVARMYLGGDRYATPAARREAAREVLARAAAMPGVREAALTSLAPMAGGSNSSMVQLEGHTFTDGGAPSVMWRPVDAGYFATLRVPLVEGRAFTAAEVADSTSLTTIVGETLARRYWPGESAIGKRIAFAGGAANPQWTTIVGVARDVRQQGMADGPQLQAYRPYAASPGRTMTLLLRAGGDPARLTPAVRQAIAGLDPALPFVAMRPLAAMVHESFWLSRLYTTLFGSFGVAALLMAVVGVYGVAAYAVAQRTREIGVRVALGARTGDVERLVLREGGVLVIAGLGIGLVAAFGLTRLLRSALYGTSASDPVVFVTVALTLAASALAATWLPARRAARVDPVTALRSE